MNEASYELVHEESQEKVDKKEYLYYFIKRSFDIIMSLLSLILLSPIFLIIAVLIKIDSEGKVIFKQERIGKGGKPIYIYKFRSMVENADLELNKLIDNDERIKEEYKKNKKIKDDPRITKMGKFIRKTSIDELPQLINILNGDMSFVGPRPYLFKEKTDMNGYYPLITRMTPGLTGLWQVSGRSDLDFSSRLLLDNEYYRKRGLLLDIKIFFKTFIAVFKGNGAK